MTSKPIAAIGLDAGSTTCKAVAIAADRTILASEVQAADPLVERQAQAMLERLTADQVPAGQHVPVAATGYGRKRIAGARRVLTEITCHARGAFYLAACSRPVVLIDIGGQDTKVIHVGPEGQVVDFMMNDKCAAGTGRFLEVILARLKVGYAEVAELARSASQAAAISSTCTVFAESEVISRVASGEPLVEIIRGLHQALATRVTALAGTVPRQSALLMSGGVAQNGAMVDALGASFGREIEVLPTPQLVGALGAALALI